MMQITTFRRVLSIFRPHWLRCLLIVLAIIVIAILGTINPVLIGMIFDQVLPYKDLNLLTLLVLALLVLPIATGLMSIGKDYLDVIVGQRIMYDLRVRLYTHLQQLSLRFYTTERAGEILSRLSNDVNGVRDVVIQTLSKIISNGVTALAVLVIMFRLNPLLAFCCCLLAPLFLYLSNVAGKKYRAVSMQRQQTMGEMTAFLEQTLNVGGALLIKSFGRQQIEIERFTTINKQLMAVEIRQTMIARWFLLSLHIFFAIVPALIYYIGGRQVIGAALTPGVLVSFIALQGNLFPALRELLNVHVEIQGAMALFERLFAYLDQPLEITSHPQAKTLKEVQGIVRFQKVNFSYRPGSLTLQDIDFTLLPGQLVALVGPSGAGKSTITYLLQRLYDVTQGVVEIDGHDIRTVSLESLVQHIGVVTQETYLFHATVRENIAYGSFNATNEAIIVAARIAQIHERILELPDGYDTLVGSRGYLLSGGEKQRIAIARVLLKDPRIFILDEATSSLDTHSERMIQDALAELMVGRTTLAIAHRLSTVLTADLILVIDKGRIVERGKHADLLKHGGIYAQLYHEQFTGHSL
jgi:ATP-binding cassette subfamily B protein